MSTSPHFREEDYARFVLGQIPREEEALIESHLRACPGCAARLEESARQIAKHHPSASFPAQPDNRSEQRLPILQDAMLQALNPLSIDHIRAKMLDVSKNGLGIRIDRAIENGTLVQIRIGSVLILGEVRYSRSDGTGFRVGIQIEDVVTALKPQPRRDGLP